MQKFYQFLRKEFHFLQSVDDDRRMSPLCLMLPIEKLLHAVPLVQHVIEECPFSHPTIEIVVILEVACYKKKSQTKPCKQGIYL